MTRLIPRACGLLTCAVVSLAAHVFTPSGARAQTASLPSHCIALVDAPPKGAHTSLAGLRPHRPGGPTLLRISDTPATLGLGEVRITYVGHSTFRIETPGGVTIATDYAGFAGPGPVPTIATMNRAHSSHYTDTPDPAIEHIMRGWNPDGGPARHNKTVKDVRVRNVPTDIRDFAGGRIEDGNSIFVFEAGGLCIGHLGHLHHKLSPDDLAKIGRLDVVLVPVDGTFTMDQKSMQEVAKALKARLIIPMHWFTLSSLNAFLLEAGKEFLVENHPSREIVLSLNDLPSEPKILVLPPY
ncbi:MAG: MBL fold metallo-hydrolase [Pseudomonadota bacterium]